MNKDQARAALDGAIAELCRQGWSEETQGSMPVGWFMVVETITPDGDRWLDWFYPDQMKTWQVKGYMTEALDGQIVGETVNRVMREMGGD